MSLAASRGEPRRVALLRPLRVVRMCLASDSPMKTTTSNKLGITLAAVLALIILPVRVDANAIAYSVTDLGTLGGSTSGVSGINASGQVAGYSLISGDSIYHAVRWTGTTPTDLGTGTSTSYGWGGINASGQVAGFASAPGFNMHAVRWTGSIPTDLGTLGGNNSAANAINSSGQVAGNSQTIPNSSFPVHAVRWTGSTAEDLGTLGGNYSDAFSINDSGQVAGFSYIAGNSVNHAVRWTGTTAEALPGLGGAFSAGYGINASGQVAGQSYLPGADNLCHAVVWTGMTLADLGTLGGGNSWALSINNFGDVTGMSEDNSGQRVPFLYTGGIMYNLNSLLVPGSGITNLSLLSVFGGNITGGNINDNGQIAATGTINGQTHALRLDPVATPEPSSVLLLLGSGLTLLLRRRRGSAL